MVSIRDRGVTTLQVTAAQARVEVEAARVESVALLAARVESVAPLAARVESEAPLLGMVVKPAEE